MNRFIIAAAIAVAAVSANAQTENPANTAMPDDQKIVAVINGETITAGKLDTMYNALPPQMRAQLEHAGGKMAFLDTYVQRRLLIQEAIKSGFDRKPDVQAAMESARDQALFDRYVRDVVAAPVVTDAEIRKYYDDHKSEFAVPESAKIRHIVISWNNKPKPDAFDIIKRVATEIRVGMPTASEPSPEQQKLLVARFAQAARRYSEDGVASIGGDLGWVAKGSLDKNFEEAAFHLQPMTMSGIVESQFGYHVILVEAKKPAGTQPLDEVKSDIRDFLLAQKSADVLGAVNRLTNELRVTSKLSFYPENVK